MSATDDSPWPTAPPPASSWSPLAERNDDPGGVRGGRSGTDRPARPADPGVRAPSSNGSGPASAWGAPAPAPRDLQGRDLPERDLDGQGRPGPGRPPASRRTTAAVTAAAAGPGPAPSSTTGEPRNRPVPRRGRTVDATGRNVRVRVVERFPGQRVRQQTGPWRRIRSAVALVVAALIVGAVLAAGLSAVVWGISVAVHHASTN